VSGRVNAPTDEVDLVEYFTKLRAEAASSREYRSLERDLTAVMNFFVFGTRERREEEIAVEP
jgi:hypothetical protein